MSEPMITIKLPLRALSVSSGTCDIPGQAPIPAVSIEVTHMNRRVSVGMASDDARALAELLYEQADRAEQVTLCGTGQPGKN